MHPLGNTLYEYGIGWLEVARRIIIMVVVVGLWLFVSDKPPSFSLNNLGTLIFFVFFVGLFALTIYPLLVTLIQNPLLRIHERGVSLTQLGREESWRWEEFTEYKGLFITYRMWPPIITYLKMGTYNFYVGDKKAIILTQLFNKPDEIYTLLTTNITRAQLPNMIRKFESGEIVTFGKLTVAKAGLMLGRKTIPLNDVKGVAGDGSPLVIILRKSTRNSLRLSKPDVPNLESLISLLHYVARPTPTGEASANVPPNKKGDPRVGSPAKA